MSSPQQLGWCPLHPDSPWNDFKSLWWGDTRTCAVSESLFLGESIEKVTTPLFTNGYILVRREYRDFYQRLEESEKEKRGGRVVSGSPGIGKSVFLLYALVRRLQEQTITLFYNANGRLYLFHESGVYKLHEPLDALDHICPLLAPNATTRPWALIDTSWSTDAKYPFHHLAEPSSLFAVQASSLDRRSYRWVIPQFGERFIMNPWTEDELYLGLRLQRNIGTYTMDDVRNVRATCGPCIRDIIREMMQRSRGARSSSRASLTPFSMTQFTHLAEEASNQDCDASQALFFIQRGPEDTTFKIDGDPDFVEVKSLDIPKRLPSSIQMTKSSLADAQQLYRFCLPFPETSVLAGWVFGLIGVELVRGGHRVHKDLFKTLYPMSPIHGVDGVSFTCASSDIVTTELRVAPMAIARATPSMDYKTPPPTLPSPPLRISPREISFLEDSDPPTTDRLYVTRTKNHTLFDAVFISRSPPHGLELWVFQMTSSARWGGPESGFDVLRDLRFRVLTANLESSQCEIKYVLVLPERPNQRVVWTMPDGWRDDIAGDVFVQYVDMEKFSTYDFHPCFLISV